MAATLRYDHAMLVYVVQAIANPDWMQLALIVAAIFAAAFALIFQAIALFGAWFYFANWVGPDTDWIQLALIMAAFSAAAFALDRYCSPFPGKPNRRP